MSPHPRVTSPRLHRPALLAALWLALALPLSVSAQSVPAASSSTSSAGSMDMGSMPGMTMPAASASPPMPATPSTVKKVSKKHAPSQLTPSSNGMEGMKGMQHDSMPGMNHHAMPAMSMPAKPATSTDAMEGMKGMDHDALPGMPMPATPAASTTSSDDMSGMDHASVPGMSSPTMKGMDHGATSKTDQAGMASMHGMTMGPMQGGNAPPDARSPDYSDGIGYGSMQGMDMRDNAPLGMLLIDQLEAFHGRDANGQRWEVQGWYGNDGNKLWLRSEGERSRGKLDDGDVEALWSHSVAAYWDTQLGARHDFGAGPSRDWVAFGVQGLAPYWFDVEATGYIGASGRTAARLRVDYELLFTQRLILQPEAEINLYGKNDPQRHIGSGLSDLQFGLRLRYEFHRQFAPFIGVNWVRRVGTSADYARQDHQPVLDRQIVAGVRLWF